MQISLKSFLFITAFHALLQIKAVRRKTASGGAENEARTTGKEVILAIDCYTVFSEV